MTRRSTLGMGGAAVVVSVSILASRLLGLLRETLLAALLGVSAEGDVYRDAFLLPDLLNYLLAGGFLSITLIPLLARHLEAGEQGQAWGAFRAVFSFVAGAIIPITAILWVTAPFLVGLLYPRLTAPALDAVVGLTRIALPAQVFFVLGALFMAVSYAQKRFLYPALAPVIYNLGIIGGGLLGAAAGQTGPSSFVWGAVVGALVGNFGLQWIGARRAGWRWTGAKAPGAVREYLLLAFPLMVGQSVAVLDEQFPRLFGQLAGTGGTAALSLARMVHMLPVGLIAQAAGVASFPFMARLAARGATAELDQASMKAARTAGALGLGACAAVIAAGEPAVRVLYQWGRFGGRDVGTVSGLLMIFSLSIPAWGIHQVVGRWFYAHRRMWVPVAVGSLATAVAIPLTLYLASQLGLAGVAWSSTIVIWLYAMVLVARWGAGSAVRSPGRLAGGLIRVLLASVPAAVGGRLVVAQLGGSDPITALPALIGGGVTVAVVFLVLARPLGIPQVLAWSRQRQGDEAGRGGDAVSGEVDEGRGG